MRNDARPIGEDLPRNPLGENQPPSQVSRDTRDSLKPEQSHIVNPPAQEDARRDDHDTDPVMPTGDSALNPKI